MSRRRDTRSRRGSVDAKRPDHREAASDERPEPRARIRRADFASGPLSGSDEIVLHSLIDYHNDVARLGETLERALEGRTGEDAAQLRALLPKYAGLRRLVFEVVEEATSHGADRTPPSDLPPRSAPGHENEDEAP